MSPQRLSFWATSAILAFGMFGAVSWLLLDPIDVVVPGAPSAVSLEPHCQEVDDDGSDDDSSDDDSSDDDSSDDDSSDDDSSDDDSSGYDSSDDGLSDHEHSPPETGWESDRLPDAVPEVVRDPRRGSRLPDGQLSGSNTWTTANGDEILLYTQYFGRNPRITWQVSPIGERPHRVLSTRDNPEPLPVKQFLSRDDARVIQRYTEDSSVWNDYLRNGNGMPALVDGLITDLTSAIRKLPQYRGVVYRDVEGSPDLLAKLRSGTWTDPGYQSASLIPHTAGLGSPVIRLNIMSRTGRILGDAARSEYNHQFEVLFEPGTRFRITSFEETEPGVWVAFGKEI